MAYIILPSRRTRQPKGPARVDWSNPLTRGLADCGYGNFSALSPQIGVAGSANASLVATSDGLAAKQVGGAGRGTLFTRSKARYVDSTEQTVFLRTRITELSATTRTLLSIAYKSTWSDPYTPLMLASGSGATRGMFYTCDYFGLAYTPDTADNFYEVTSAFADYGVVRNGLSVAFKKNGALFDTKNLNSNKTTDFFAAVGDIELHQTLSNSEAFPAETTCWAIWCRALSDDEYLSVSRNPWQLFATDPRRIYFGASGGGANIFESTFATSWSLSEAYSTSATLVSTYADSPTVTDSSSSSAVFSSAFAETIPVSDGPSADMGGVANRTQEESFTITDAYSASMVATATISETLSAEASASAAAIFNATFAETLPIVDGEEADAGRISDIAENVTVTDAYTAGIVAQATQAESVTTIDTYDTIAIYNPTLEETLPITDTVGATLTVPTSGTVDLSQESIDSLAHEIMVQLTSTPVRKL